MPRLKSRIHEPVESPRIRQAGFPVTASAVECRNPQTEPRCHSPFSIAALDPPMKIAMMAALVWLGAHRFRLGRGARGGMPRTMRWPRKSLASNISC